MGLKGFALFPPDREKNLSFGGFDWIELQLTETMAQDSASEQDPDESDVEPEFVEVDPSGRYGRVSIFMSLCIWDSLGVFHNCHPNEKHTGFILEKDLILGIFCCIWQYKEILGKGAFKKVYVFF